MEALTLPKSPFKPNKYQTYTDLHKFREVNILILQTSVPLSEPFKAAYNRLFDLKTQILCEQQKEQLK